MGIDVLAMHSWSVITNSRGCPGDPGIICIFREEKEHLRIAKVVVWPSYGEFGRPGELKANRRSFALGTDTEPHRLHFAPRVPVMGIAGGDGDLRRSVYIKVQQIVAPPGAHDRRASAVSQ